MRQLIENLQLGLRIQGWYSWYLNRQRLPGNNAIGYNKLEGLSLMVYPDETVFPQTLRNYDNHQQLTTIMISEMIQHSELMWNAGVARARSIDTRNLKISF